MSMNVPVSMASHFTINSEKKSKSCDIFSYSGQWLACRWRNNK